MWHCLHCLHCQYTFYYLLLFSTHVLSQMQTLVENSCFNEWSFAFHSSWFFIDIFLFAFDLVRIEGSGLVCSDSFQFCPISGPSCSVKLALAAFLLITSSHYASSSAGLLPSRLMILISTITLGLQHTVERIAHVCCIVFCCRWETANYTEGKDITRVSMASFSHVSSFISDIAVFVLKYCLG